MDLFCVPESREQGIARALVEAVYEEAKSNGIPGMYWMTQEFNYKGRMLYDKIATRTPFIMYTKGE